jgi:ribosomal protein L11 methyltransferase
MEQNVQSVHIHLSFEHQDVLIAFLCDLGFDGFEQSDDHFIAYIPFSDFNPEELNQLLNLHQVTYSLSIIEKTNWNAIWESNFQPLLIANRLAVRADFHSPIENVSQELVITPRMSFGTGHHATTSLMLEALLDIPLQDTRVLDFGTGTGILGILAAKLGAQFVLGIDNDTWSIENATDNCKMNAVTIDLLLSDEPPAHQTFDFVLANINLHIIKANLIALAKCLQPNGTLLLSGLLTQDEQMVDASCFEVGLQKKERFEKNGWVLLFYQPIA